MSIFNPVCSLAERHVENLRTGLHQARIFNFAPDVANSFDGKYKPAHLIHLHKNFMLPHVFVFLDSFPLQHSGLMLWDTENNQVGFGAPRCFAAFVSMLHADDLFKLAIPFTESEKRGMAAMERFPPDVILTLSGVVTEFNVTGDFHVSYDGKLEWAIATTKQEKLTQVSTLYGEGTGFRSGLQRLCMAWAAQAIEALMLSSRPSALLVEFLPKVDKAPRTEERILRTPVRPHCAYLTTEEIRLQLGHFSTGNAEYREYPPFDGETNEFMTPAAWCGPKSFEVNSKRYNVLLNV